MKATKQALSLVNLIKNQPEDSDLNSVSFGLLVYVLSRRIH